MNDAAAMEVPIKSLNSAPKPVSEQEAAELVSSIKWYHSFEIVPGLKTPGQVYFNAGRACDTLSVPADLSGRSALDVGAWDGPITFELERRGAAVCALDIQAPSRVGFDIARRILGSKAVHYQGSVYQLPFGDMTNLDIVVFRGVLYHLKHPLLALERINASLKIGGTLHFETEGFLQYAEALNGEPIKTDWKAINASGAPLCLAYPNRYKGSSNWFIPNSACLAGWFEVCGFTVRKMESYTDNDKAQRLLGFCEKTSDRFQKEHPIY